MKMKAAHSTKKARIEIIPLIDVIFFLLATFVLISLAMTRLLGMPLEFPEATTKPPVGQEDTDMVTIKVTAEDKILWNNDPISYDSLPIAIAKYKRENPNARILIQGEEASSFGIAVRILDESRNLGLTQVSVQTKVAR
ncbi:MAG: biopolymer transporter ExbD [Verrucomicrobiota bacterium]|nr:biopolymer transporter ExbD [Verrucomicrobiota bacterium]